MARPQSPDYDKRREAIVAAAARLYAQRGFQGASVADLAKACDTSKSLIYHYFPAKDDILHAVMAEHLDALVTAAEEARRGGGSPENQLRTLTLAFMRHYVGAQDRHKVLLNELDNLPAVARQDVVAKQRRVIATTEAIIADLAPGQDARVSAMLFFGMINWTHTWFDPAGPVMPEMLALRVVDLMLRGVQGGVQAS
ncbi:TetR/AcrR family transcriptional regulator [Sphingosinicella sp. LHD-64]|uniref:TetR/AcrR family transcriptional regulator n=1 Tax=Sphingosinicella sp. LHD-64 TaxID=3072139 RepID=UPI00280F22DF|nr:TetR/AcrR family transcriptional regulator [Sphingosinicella sp. LHD-64]MDQ8754906.1 TetR/AcrR family transcriptional regulator [Sphingosinicella sp. LHD-64]